MWLAFEAGVALLEERFDVRKVSNIYHTANINIRDKYFRVVKDYKCKV